nr:hypothetical protein [uncultured Anaeromusa sp.]
MGEENRLYHSGALAAALGAVGNVYGQIAESLGKRRFDTQDKDGIERLLRKRRSRRGRR